MGAIKREGGFTLLEVIISMGILAVILLSFGNIMTTALSIQGRTKMITEVNNNAASSIEQKQGVSAINTTLNYTFPTTPTTVSFVIPGKLEHGSDSRATYTYFRPNNWSR